MTDSATLCNACNILLHDDEIARVHYRSPLHSANLKRRVAELPPITAEAFGRAQRIQEEAQKKQEEEDAEDCVFICDACHKSFHSAGQFATHNGSTKHKTIVKALLAERKAAAAAVDTKEKAISAVSGVSSTTTTTTTTTTTPTNNHSGSGSGPVPGIAEKSTSSSKTTTSSGKSKKSQQQHQHKQTQEQQEELVISSSHCVFCWEKQDDLEANLRHMRVSHSFFVPDIEYCEHPDALVEYLHAKVIEGRYCLWCDSNKQYESPEATRQHMKDSFHCSMRYDEPHHFEEFEDFYNYADSDDDEEFEKGVGEEDGDAEEADDDDDNDDDGAMMVAVGDKGAFVASNGTDLVLPSGKVAVHKSLMKYYKQYIRTPDTRESVRVALGRLSLEYGSASNAPPRTSRAIAAAKAGLHRGARGNNVDIKAQKYTQHASQRRALLNSLSMNDIRTKHIRLQMMGCG